MTKLVSGRILKTPSANVSAERYQFLEISEAEPDLGVPPANNYIFTSDPEGNRQWVDLRTTLANESFSVGNIIVADTIFGNDLIVQNIDILDAIIGITTLANNIVTVTILADSITANTWNNLYTANVIESDENLFYTNDRVFSNIQLASVGDLNDVTIANIDVGQALVWDGNIFIPVFVNSEVANVADLSLRVLSIENFTTANVKEASSNLYFTNSRVLDALVTSNVRVNDLFVSGDLVVQGNSAVLNVSTLIVEDKNIVIANGAASASIADGAGITIEGANATILYKESGDKFELNKNLDVQGNITAGVGTGGSITGANIISGETLVADLLQVDTVVSNTIVNTESITADILYANIEAVSIAVDSLGGKTVNANTLTSNLLNITGIAQVNGYDVLTKELTDATFEPMGHEDKANSIITFDANTRQFTIAPVGNSYTVWVKGNKFVKTGSESVTLDNATDLYYIYFNTDGNIAVRSSYFDWENDALTSYVYFNANTQTAPFFADERHGITLDWATHEYLHRTRGAAIAEGFSIGNFTVSGDGSLDSHAQIDIGNGTFFDEDLEVTITHSNSPTPDTWEQDLQGPARIPMFYLVGTEWVRDEPTDFPLKTGTSRIKYNQLLGNQWTVPDVPSDGYFTTTWIIATNNLNYPILAVMGQTANDTIGEEEAINFQDLTLTNFPVIEFRPLYKLIWSTNTGYVNTPRARLIRVYDLRNIISASPSAAIASDHGLLSGLGDDDHAQYLHIENARTVTASHTFSGIQAFANITVSGSMVGNLTGQVSDISNHSINALSDVDITGILPGQIISWDGAKFIPGSADSALFSERSNVAQLANVANVSLESNVANIVLSLNNFTTNDLNEGNINFYFSNARARQAFTAGRGIIIQENGVIKSTDDSDLYNLDIDGTIGYLITDSMETAVLFPSVPSNDRFILRSLHITNITEEDAFISANILYATGNTAYLADMLPVPVGGVLEFLKRTQIFSPGDKINLQSFDSTGTPANNTLSATLTYETLPGEIAFFGTGQTLSIGNTDTLIYNSDQSYTILESIKLVNLEDYTIKAKVYWADSNGNPKSYLSYNLPLPPNSSVEILQAPKRINFTDKLYASYIANSELSVFVSGRLGSLFTLEEFTGNLDPGSNIVASFATTEVEGTTLYYTIE
jgi:hypothetical protein